AALRPIARQIPRTLHWIFDDVASGAFWRTIRAAWRFALHLMVVQAPLVGWLALTIVAGCGAGFALARVTQSVPAGLLAGAAVAAALFALLRPLGDRSVLLQIANGWPLMRDFARGRPSGYDQPVEAFAQRLVAAARADEADEILIVGHSAGGLTAP